MAVGMRLMGGNAGNPDLNAKNRGGNAGNQGGNAGNKTEIEKKKVYEIKFSFFAGIKKKLELS